MELYFSDRFFSSGTTDITDRSGNAMGFVDLQSMLTASLTVHGPDSRLAYAGHFRFFSNKWEVSNPNGSTVGLLRYRLSLFSKRYEYDALGRGLYSIESPAFSRSYSILNNAGTEVAAFDRVSGLLQAGAYRLRNRSPLLDSYELIAVVMGVHHIQRRMNASAAT